MTFSSASASACGVDDVAATAAVGGGLRAGGKAACWRVAGAKEGASGAVLLAEVFAAGAVFLVEVFLVEVSLVEVSLAEVLGTTLRAIGRGFGSGTLGLVAASAANADNPTASARLVARAVDKAVDRNAAARADWVTSFLRGESFNR
jgi:hypothetical protein